MTRRLTAPALSTALVAIVVALSGCSLTALTDIGTIDQSDGFGQYDDGEVYTEDDEDLGVVEVYTVEPDASLSPPGDETTESVWDMFVRIVTPEVAGSVIRDFRVGDSESSDTLAYVLQTDDPEQWTLVVNLAYASDEDLLLSTLIHEYAHILSLSPGQTDPEAWSCDTLQLDEGCAEPDSALWAFDQEFWAQYGSDAPDPANADADLAYEFYLDHEDDFVSDYAATNVVEDFAESFMTFVLEPEPDSDTTIAQKLLFFWDRPEYVEIRDHVRAEFGL
ncbi:NADH:ubiquinone oxidoreductase subunit 4 (chain M) [Microbacterium sp.]|uniref:NADH:ubiquinone oxidoreductase subunit 4 (chain M) n=1 Tax=Microbacterium sp. TaxID=51671 RepID=UPI00261136B5|nr:NADH:ubiquinone oxidoreductase subunit 4 (chain M) [Microbacterium sp.]